MKSLTVHRPKHAALEQVFETKLNRDQLCNKKQMLKMEVFTVPHIVQSDSGQTQLDNNVSRIQFFW